MLDLDVEVEVSSGTYVRALARDLGAALGVGGHLTALRRTRVGRFDLAAASTMSQLQAARDAGDGVPLVPLADAARASFARRELSPAEATAVGHGQRHPLAAPAAHRAGGGLRPRRCAWWPCWTSAARWRRPTSSSPPRVRRVSPVLRWTDLSQIPAGFGPSVVTLGNFDGVHRGHRAVLGAVVRAGPRHRLPTPSR